MKKIVITLLLIAIAITSASVINPLHASSTATLGVDPSTENFLSAHIGDTIQVNITLNNVQDLWAWDIADLTFNPAVLNLTNILEGPFLQTSGQQTLFIWSSTDVIGLNHGYVQDTSDTILAAGASASGSGVIATLIFKVLSIGSSEILFNQTTLLNPNQIVPSGGTTTGNYEQINCNAIDAIIIVGTQSSSSLAPSSSASSSSSPGSSSAPSSSASSSSSPDSSTNPQAPEFPTLLIFIPFVAAATFFTLLISKKVKLNKK